VTGNAAEVSGRIWDVYPAIDLRQGRVVRLMQGDPRLETEYGRDPLAIAQRWRAAGARWLHVVNLDGALDESSAPNLAALERVLGAGLRVQFGGGLRDMGSLSHVLALGVTRAVVGTAALEDPAFLETALATFGGERIALAIDARDGRVRTHGWQEETEVRPEALAQRWAERGLRWAIFTDVARDGVESGLNVAANVHLAQVSGLHVIASGGVAALEDVERAYRAGLSGVIIGRALYEGRLRLEEALAVGSAQGER